MKILVFVEHHGGELQCGALGVLSKAASLGAGPVAAVLAGTGVKALAGDAAAYGASTVIVVDDPALGPPLAQPRVDVLERLVCEGGYDTVLFAGSVLAADVAAGLSSRIDAGLNWDLVDLAVDGSSLVGKRYALQDSICVEVGWRSDVRLALFRPGSFELVSNGGHAPVVEGRVALEEHSTLARLVGQEIDESEGPPIEDASVIVAGGRGLGSPEHFKLAEDLAVALGGAVGATRAVVDAGWYPYAAQIGQTGKTVAPRLYVALGISGAIQHKVGMQGSNVIVAINKDPNAPIFDFSDLGVVGDLHEIVPRLIELVSAKRAG